jgi:tetratricopeptide (TPR) repeat protein
MIETASLTERIEQCERILKENSRSQVFAALADAHRLNGDLDQAFRICRQGIRTHPDYGVGHLVMAKISLGRKMYDWAEQELDKAVELDGETRLTEQLRVEILLARQYGEASQQSKNCERQRQSPTGSGFAAKAGASEKGRNDGVEPFPDHGTGPRRCIMVTLVAEDADDLSGLISY